MGGGAEMQHIEELFARELKVDDVRTVFPEYGFTENLTQFITTSAQAMAASLLLYGAEHGSCSVAVRQNRIRVDRPTVPPTEPKHQIEPQPQPEEPKRPVKPIPEAPVFDEDDLDDDEIFVEGDKENKRGFKSKIKKLFDKMSNSFTGSDDELEM